AAAAGAARVLRGDRLRPACAGARGGVRAAIAGGSVGDGARLSPGGGRDLARQVLGGRVRPRLEPIRLPPHAARGADAPPPAAVLRAPRRRDRVRRGVRAAVLGSVLLRRAAPAWRGRGDRALLDPARSGGRRRRGGGAHPTSGVSLQRGLRRLRYQPTASPAASDSSSALFGPWSGGAERTLHPESSSLEASGAALVPPAPPEPPLAPLPPGSTGTVPEKPRASSAVRDKIAVPSTKFTFCDTWVESENGDAHDPVNQPEGKRSSSKSSRHARVKSPPSSPAPGVYSWYATQLMNWCTGKLLSEKLPPKFALPGQTLNRICMPSTTLVANSSATVPSSRRTSSPSNNQTMDSGVHSKAYVWYSPQRSADVVIFSVACFSGSP